MFDVLVVKGLIDIVVVKSEYMNCNGVVLKMVFCQFFFFFVNNGYYFVIGYVFGYFFECIGKNLWVMVLDGLNLLWNECNCGNYIGNWMLKIGDYVEMGDGCGRKCFCDGDGFFWFLQKI